MLPLIVSYYTLGTPYEEEVKNLIASCKKLGLNTDIVGIKPLGKWDQNCCYKPLFLLEKLREHKKPILWIDADAMVLKKPLLFETLKCDIALRIYPYLPITHPSKLITGTLYLQNTLAVRNILTLWDQECIKMAHQNKGEVWDQIGLKRALLNGPKINLFSLPSSYAAIYDKKESLQEELVIVHYQASRLFKKVINREVVSFWEKSAFSQKNRKTFVKKNL